MTCECILTNLVWVEHVVRDTHTHTHTRTHRCALTLLDLSYFPLWFLIMQIWLILLQGAQRSWSEIIFVSAESERTPDMWVHTHTHTYQALFYFIFKEDWVKELLEPVRRTELNQSEKKNSAKSDSPTGIKICNLSFSGAATSLASLLWNSLRGLA